MVAPLHTFDPSFGPLEIVDVLGDDGLSRRLCELGFSTGRTVSLVKSGNPAIVETDGARFAIGIDLLARVFARPL